MLVSVLDYGAGNILSLVNALKSLNHDVLFIETPQQILAAHKLVFPGVGAFASAMHGLKQSPGIVEALKIYLESNRPFLGICVGLQTLFSGSEESPGIEGLGLIQSTVKLLRGEGLAVPHVGWNGVNVRRDNTILLETNADEMYYFVHSYAAVVDEATSDWLLATSDYGCEFVSVVQRGNVVATQFHPEKSGAIGLALLQRFVDCDPVVDVPRDLMPIRPVTKPTRLAKRVVACLDVRANDNGDLVVTKGDQYDVRERVATNDRGRVRNLGKPVDLAARYYEEGADEIVFLNITSFRNCPLQDLPMLEVLRKASEKIFVPLTVGGGIRDMHAPKTNDSKSDVGFYSALDVAAAYFRSGADKISIGSDAVYAAEEYVVSGGKKTGKTSIEMIAATYGKQAVVISVDPKRVYVASPTEVVRHRVIRTVNRGPNAEEYCWYQCTVSGGRESRDIDVHEMVKACEDLGAGEIMLNCIDKDGTNSGYDIEFIADVKAAVHIPVIASSGAGCAAHFSEVFQKTNADAALAAGIFHRHEVPIETVKKHLAQQAITVRQQ